MEKKTKRIDIEGWFCPVCGTERETYFCRNCDNHAPVAITKRTLIYYRRRALELYGDEERYGDVVIEEELSKGELWNPDAPKGEYDRITGYYSPEKVAEREALFRKAFRGVRCPSCGEFDIRKISDLRKVASAMTFGVFSKTARSTYQCNTCKYKW